MNAVLWTTPLAMSIGTIIGVVTTRLMMDNRVPAEKPPVIAAPGRIEVVAAGAADYYAFTVVRDTASGAEYLAFRGGLIKLEPAK